MDFELFLHLPPPPTRDNVFYMEEKHPVSTSYLLEALKGVGGGLEPEEHCWAQDGHIKDEQMDIKYSEEEVEEEEMEGVEKEARVNLPEL